MATRIRGLNFLLRGGCLLVAAALFTSLVPSPSGTAYAQEYRRQQRGLLDFLFGGARLREVPPQPRREIRRVRPRRAAPQQAAPKRARSPVAGAPGTRQHNRPPPVPVIEKLENARTVLVVGDFLAGGLAEGLEIAYAQSPGVRVVNRTNGSSGFVRDDFYNWNAEITAILDEVDPAIAVMMIGSNDRQQLVIDGKRETPRTEAWMAEYVQRVTAFATAMQEREIPLIWTGVPPFKSSLMSSDMLAFNDIYKKAAEAVDGAFVDIWDGFVDENGAFIFTGPDMNGQSVRLRGSDGTNLTAPAKRKVAFYVEKPLNKLLGQAVSPDIGALGMENLPDLALPAEGPQPINRTAPISLNDPGLDGGQELLGEIVRPASAEADNKEKRKVIASPSVPGRADDFTLRAPSPQ